MKRMLSDKEIALKEAARLLDADDEPYLLSINHDVRAAASRSNKPRTGACPVDYTWAKGSLVGISVITRLTAKRWIMAALEHGYTVARLSRNNEPMATASIASAKRMLEYADKRAAMTSKEREIDDAIPF